jgi:hypothetical protein
MILKFDNIIYIIYIMKLLITGLLLESQIVNKT